MSLIFLLSLFFLFLIHLPFSEQFFKIPGETNNATKDGVNGSGNATTGSTDPPKTTMKEKTGRICAKHGKPKTTSLCKTTPNFCDFYKSGGSGKISVRIIAENRNGFVCAEGKLTRTCSTEGKHQVCQECAAGPIRNKIRGKFVCDMYSAGDRVCKLKSEDGIVCRKVPKGHKTGASKSTVAPKTILLANCTISTEISMPRNGSFQTFLIDFRS